MLTSIRIEVAASLSLAVVQRTAGKRERGAVIQEACGTVWNALRAQQVQGAGRHIALYFGDSSQLQIGVELPQPFAGHGEVLSASTPGGRVATATHFGPYGELDRARVEIPHWCQAQGESLAGPWWEIYDHWQQAWNNDPQQIRTDLYFLLG